METKNLGELLGLVQQGAVHSYPWSPTFTNLPTTSTFKTFGLPENLTCIGPLCGKKSWCTMRLAAATAPTSTQFSNAELILYRYPNETWWNTTNFKCFFLYVDILWKISSTKSVVFRHLDHSAFQKKACRRKSLMEKIKAFRPSHNQSTASGWCSTDVVSEIFPNLNLPTKVPLRSEPRGPRFHKWPPGGFLLKVGSFVVRFPRDTNWW